MFLVKLDSIGLSLNLYFHPKKSINPKNLNWLSRDSFHNLVNPSNLYFKPFRICSQLF